MRCINYLFFVVHFTINPDGNIIIMTQEFYFAHIIILNYVIGLELEIILLYSHSQHVQITDHNLDEYIGPILVQHCEPYEDSAIVKTEQELKVVCNALLSTE